MQTGKFSYVKLQNLTELKEVIASAVMKQLDHKNIDVDVDFFRVREKKIDNLVFPQLFSKINLFLKKTNRRRGPSPPPRTSPSTSGSACGRASRSRRECKFKYLNLIYLIVFMRNRAAGVRTCSTR